ncbi:hypothetical protein GCM10020255_024610 [Rhodococcus baikonurensis]
MHGHRAITPDTSLRLAKLFGVDEAHWLDMQTRYDIEIAKETTDLSQVQPLAVNHLVYRLQPSWRPRHQPDVYVPADLRTLTGPRQGSYDPPVNLYWQPGTSTSPPPAMSNCSTHRPSPQRALLNNSRSGSTATPS